MNKSKVEAYFCIAKSPVLVGAGEGYGRADCNIQRETATHLPKIDGTVLKGAATEIVDKSIGEIIRKESGNAKLAFTDLHLLFFPVKSSKGIYTLVSCPMCIERFCKEMMWAGKMSKETSYRIKKILGYVYYGYVLRYSDKIEQKKQMEVIAGQRFWVNESTLIREMIQLMQLGEKLYAKVGIINDRDFLHIVNEKTEFVVRNKLLQNRAEKKKLFTEEYLPEESILYGFIFEMKDIVNPVKEDLLGEMITELQQARVFIGKNYTLGKGSVLIQQIG